MCAQYLDDSDKPQCLCQGSNGLHVFNAMINTPTKLSYGLGGGVYAIKESAYAIFILLFYTQVLGLSGAVTGAIIALSLVWDGISDPLIGSWSDRFRSR